MVIKKKGREIRSRERMFLVVEYDWSISDEWDEVYIHKEVKSCALIILKYFYPMTNQYN